MIGPRKIVILLGAGAASADSRVRGIPWYRPNRPRAPTAASCAGVGLVLDDDRDRSEPLAERLGQALERVHDHRLHGVVVDVRGNHGADSSGVDPTSAGPADPRLPLTSRATIAPNDFTHLHVHSEFSLLDGLGRITELVDAAAQQGMDSLALTDHGALYGAVAFYQAARTKGIKPIIGVETYVARRSMTDKEGKADAQPFHLILLAQDWTGYQNLCRLITDAHIDGYYYKPRIDREHLARHSEGLIGLSACLERRDPARRSRSRTGSSPATLAGEYGDIFGKDRFFLELQDHGLPEQRRLNEQLLRLGAGDRAPARRHQRPPLRPRRDQSEAHDVLLCVGTGNNLDTPNRMRFETHEFYVKSAAQMAALFPDQPRRDPEHAADRRDDRHRAAARPAADPAFPGARRPHRRRAGCARSASAASSAATGRSRRSSRPASTTSSA